MIKEKYSLEFLAISLGRALQSGTLLFINLLYMVYADPKLYVSLGIALAWSGPLSLLVMFGGYISASQLKNKSYQNEEEIVE